MRKQINHLGRDSPLSTAACRAPAMPGFTLIELLIVVVIVGVLASIAYPSYLSYLVRSNRAVAQSYLMDLANRQQQYLLDKRAYAAGITALNAPAVPSDVSANYTVTDPFSPASTATTFRVQAVPITTRAQKNDGTLSIDQDGTKLPVGKW